MNGLVSSHASSFVSRMLTLIFFLFCRSAVKGVMIKSGKKPTLTPTSLKSPPASSAAAAAPASASAASAGGSGSSGDGGGAGESYIPNVRKSKAWKRSEEAKEKVRMEHGKKVAKLGEAYHAACAKLDLKLAEDEARFDAIIDKWRTRAIAKTKGAKTNGQEVPKKPRTRPSDRLDPTAIVALIESSSFKLFVTVWGIAVEGGDKLPVDCHVWVRPKNEKQLIQIGTIKKNSEPTIDVHHFLDFPKSCGLEDIDIKAPAEVKTSYKKKVYTLKTSIQMAPPDIAELVNEAQDPGEYDDEDENDSKAAEDDDSKADDEDSDDVEDDAEDGDGDVAMTPADPPAAAPKPKPEPKGIVFAPPPPNFKQLIDAASAAPSVPDTKHQAPTPTPTGSPPAKKQKTAAGPVAKAGAPESVAAGGVAAGGAAAVADAPNSNKRKAAT
jgi:hypothetical protein